MLEAIIDPNSGLEIDLRGLPLQERVYVCIHTFADPTIYDGKRGEACLVGQAVDGLLDQSPSGISSDHGDCCHWLTVAIAGEFNTELFDVIARIYALAASYPNDKNIRTAKRMARSILGIERMPRVKKSKHAPSIPATATYT